MITKTKTTIPLVRINVALVALVVATFLLRLIFANVAAAQTNDTANQLNQAKQLSLENEQLQLSVAELRSIERLNQVSIALSLVRSEKVIYLQPRGSVAFNH
ncbi:MAG: hypothetical protein V1846_05010 [Candidatus Komeilibacteria bacterium]